MVRTVPGTHAPFNACFLLLWSLGKGSSFHSGPSYTFKKVATNQWRFPLHPSHLQYWYHQLPACPLTHWFPPRAFHLILPGKQRSINCEEDTKWGSPEWVHHSPAFPFKHIHVLGWAHQVNPSLSLFPPTASASWRKIHFLIYPELDKLECYIKDRWELLKVCWHLF